MSKRRLLGADRIAIRDRGVLPPPVEAPPPTMYWESFNIEINNTQVALSPKTNPIVIQPVEGYVRLRIRRSGYSDVFSDFSANLGPGASNQPRGLQCIINTLVYGVITTLAVRVWATDPAEGTTSDWDDVLTWNPFPGGPFEIPLVSSS